MQHFNYVCFIIYVKKFVVSLQRTLSVMYFLLHSITFITPIKQCLERALFFTLFAAVFLPQVVQPQTDTNNHSSSCKYMGIDEFGDDGLLALPLLPFTYEKNNRGFSMQVASQTHSTRVFLWR